MLIVLKILSSILKAIYENDMLGSVDVSSKKAGHWLELEFQVENFEKKFKPAVAVWACNSSPSKRQRQRGGWKVQSQPRQFHETLSLNGKEGEGARDLAQW